MTRVSCTCKVDAFDGAFGLLLNERMMSVRNTVLYSHLVHLPSTDQQLLLPRIVRQPQRCRFLLPGGTELDGRTLPFNEVVVIVALALVRGGTVVVVVMV